MADVIHRTATPVDYRRSVNTPDFPEPTWLANPDLSGVAGVPQRYWNPPGPAGTGPTEMSVGEKAAVDAAELDAAREDSAARVDQVEDVLRAALLTILDELNDQHTATVNALLDAIDSAPNLASLKTAVAAMPNIPTRTIGQFRTSIRNKLGT